MGNLVVSLMTLPQDVFLIANDLMAGAVLRREVLLLTGPLKTNGMKALVLYSRATRTDGA